MKEEKTNVRKKHEKKNTSYFLPMYSVVSSEHLPLSSSEVNGRKHKLSLRCLLVLKYALEVESDSSVPEDTGREKNDILT